MVHHNSEFNTVLTFKEFVRHLLVQRLRSYLSSKGQLFHFCWTENNHYTVIICIQRNQTLILQNENRLQVRNDDFQKPQIKHVK